LRLFSVLKLHFSSFWSSKSSSYRSYSRSMLVLLCRWKDVDILELQHVCDLLSEVCSKMSSQLLMLQEREQAPQQEDKREEWEEKFVELKEKLAFQEEEKQKEIAKLHSENLWLQNRLAEKLQHARLQGDMIDQLKKDLIASVQQTEISAGRCLCYEHKIKQLEKQLEEATSEGRGKTLHKERLSLLREEQEEESPEPKEAMQLTQLQEDLLQRTREEGLLREIIEEQFL